MNRASVGGLGMMIEKYESDMRGMSCMTRFLVARGVGLKSVEECGVHRKRRRRVVR